MDVQVVRKNENKLLDRTEMEAIIDHLNEPTPKREEIRVKLSALLGVSEDLVVIRKIRSMFGLSKSKILAHIYKDKETLMKLEPKHILKRNKLIE